MFSILCRHASDKSVTLLIVLEHGIYVIGFSYPVVPKGKARIRVQISAAHTEDQIKKAIEAFTTVGSRLKVIP